MSEDPATYYTPQARITQNKHGVWVMASDNTGVLIRHDDDGSHVAYVSNFADEVTAGREMALVPKETLQAIAAALRTAHMHLPETDANAASIASLEWAQARLETVMEAQ